MEPLTTTEIPEHTGTGVSSSLNTGTAARHRRGTGLRTRAHTGLCRHLLYRLPAWHEIPGRNEHLQAGRFRG